MRKPALRNPRLLLKPRYLSHPEPGFFRLKQRRHGVWVPALIWRPCPWVEPAEGPGCAAPEDWCRPTHRSRPLRARIGDTETSPLEVWERGSEIGPAEFHFRAALREWAIAAAPESPEARADEPVNLNRIGSLF
jgi:hypothetical protein